MEFLVWFPETLHKTAFTSEHEKYWPKAFKQSDIWDAAKALTVNSTMMKLEDKFVFMQYKT